MSILVAAYLGVGLLFGACLACTADIEYFYPGNKIRLANMRLNGWRSSLTSLLVGVLFWLPLMFVASTIRSSGAHGGCHRKR